MMKFCNSQVYEKAIDEAKYCSLYAQLCLRLRHDVPNFDDPVKKTNVRNDYVKTSNLQ